MLYRDDHTLWVEKYRPRTVEECILPDSLKVTFQTMVDKGSIPNLLLCGSPGTGKTTIAKALCNELDADLMFLNASNENGIDVIRSKVSQFGSSVSFKNTGKVIILDEADFLTDNAQAALRHIIEDFAGNCSFILTCNYKNRIISALHSRTSVIDFHVNNEDKKVVLANLCKRSMDILKAEGIDFKKVALLETVKKYFPDVRRLFNQLQTYANAYGTIDEGILSIDANLDLNPLFDALKAGKYNDVRKWVVDAADNDHKLIFRKLYDGLKGKLKSSSIPMAVLIIGEYAHRATSSIDQEINLMACLTQLMGDCEYE